MKLQYDKEELEIITAIENDELVPAPNSKQLIEKMEAAARSMSKKNKRMNIRMSERDMEMLKAKALEEGIPYQSLVSSILHKYVSGRLREV